MHFACRAGVDHQTGAGAQAGAYQVMVHRSGRQQRRDRHARRARRAVGQDQYIGALADGFFCRLAQCRDRRFAAFCAVLHRIGDVQHLRLVSALGELFDVVQLGDVFLRQHGLMHFQTRGRFRFVDAKQVGLGADERGQRHHDLFADRVDRRVGHLREQLLEVVVQHLVLARQHRQRGVGAHGTDGFFARGGHRQHQELGVFLRVTEGLLRIEQAGCVLQFDLGLGQVVEVVARLLDPVAIRFGGSELLLQLVIVDDASGLHVDEEHLARLQTPFLDDLLFGEIQHAHFGRHQHDVVFGDQIARGTQTVTVQRRADHAAVGEGHGGGAVPRLHQRGMVFVERAALFVHQRIAGPGFGDQHHHRVRQRVSARHQQFQRVVETGGVGLAFDDQRPQFVEVLAEELGRHRRVARSHPVDVAAQRIDLAVVRNHAERMRQIPGGESVGGETLVHQREGTDQFLVLQIEEVFTDLVGQQHALVDDGARRQGRNVEALALPFRQAADRMFGGLADDEQFALEGILVGSLLAASDEHLAHQRFDRFYAFTQTAVVHRHIAPAQQCLSFGLDLVGDDFFAGSPCFCIAWQEQHADAVFAGGWQVDFACGQHLAQERIGNLNQDTGTIARQRIGTDCTAVRQVLQNLQPLADPVVTCLTFDMCDESDTTCIMFMAWIIETLLLRQRRIAHLVPHLDHPIKTAALAAFQLFLRKGGNATLIWGGRATY